MTLRKFFLAFLIAATAAAGADSVTFPLIPETEIPIEELRVSDNAYAAVRIPPGEGPLPAVVFLHGGLGHSPMNRLRENAVRLPAIARFLAWGYVTVTATRRDISHDPQDREIVADVMALVDAVRRLQAVDPGSVFLYGGSGGGTLALEVASVTRNVAGVVAGEPATIIYMGMLTRNDVIFDKAGRPVRDRRGDIMKADPHQLYTPELKAQTRRKLGGLDCPVLILHGDVHPLKEFNLGLFVPEMEAMGKNVTAKLYPGEPHGFYWGQGRDTTRALESNSDAEAFLRQHSENPPRPVPSRLQRLVKVEPMRRAGDN